MIKYKDLDLKKIVDAEQLDFAHYTYMRGQCSCCYGPLDMPARYWRNGEKPRKRFLTEDKSIWDYVFHGEKYDTDSTIYILFKNACNGSGTVKAEDLVEDYTCIGYNLRDMDQVRRICAMLQEQLGEDYVVQEPKNESICIIIREKNRL